MSGERSTLGGLPSSSCWVMYSRAEIESWVSFVEEDEGAEEGVSEAEVDSVIAGPPTPVNNKRVRSGHYSNRDCMVPVWIRIGALLSIGY